MASLRSSPVAYRNRLMTGLTNTLRKGSRGGLGAYRSVLYLMLAYMLSILKLWID